MVKKRIKFKPLSELLNNPQPPNVKRLNNSLNTSSDLSLGSESNSTNANDSTCVDDNLSDSPNKDKSLTAVGSEDFGISGSEVSFFKDKDNSSHQVDDHNRISKVKTSDIAGFKKLSVGDEDEVSSKVSYQEKVTFNPGIKKNREPGAGGNRMYGNSAGGAWNTKNVHRDEKQWGNHQRQRDFPDAKNKYYSNSKRGSQHASCDQPESWPTHRTQPIEEKNRSLASISEPINKNAEFYDTSNESTDTSQSNINFYNSTQDAMNTSSAGTDSFYSATNESWDDCDLHTKELEGSTTSGGIGKKTDQPWSRIVQSQASASSDCQNAYLPKNQRPIDRTYSNQNIEQRRGMGRGRGQSDYNRGPLGPSKKFEQTDAPFTSEKSVEKKSRNPDDDVNEDHHWGSYEKNDYSQNWRYKDDTDNKNNRNYSKRYSEGNDNAGYRKSYGDSKITRQSREYFDRDFENVDTEYKQFQGERRRNKEEVVFKRVSEIQQDLFAMGKEYSLAHCVAEDMRMGSGIAVTFKRDFKDIDVLFSQRQKQGGLAVLQQEERNIYYLVTKRVSNGKPTYETLWSSLKKMRDHIKENRVEKLAIPRLGCGLDRLEWGTVKHMIEFLFRDVDIEITVCNFQQTEDSPEKPHNSTCKVVNVMKPIADIEEETSIIYLSTEDGDVSTEMQELNKKYPFLGEFNRASKKIGDIVKHQVPKRLYILNGCIVRKTKNDPFDFIGFRKCVQQINKDCRKEKYYYVAFQAVSDDKDELLNEKIITILKNYLLTNVELYVCWDGDLACKMPLTGRE